MPCAQEKLDVNQALTHNRCESTSKELGAESVILKTTLWTFLLSREKLYAYLLVACFAK